MLSKKTKIISLKKYGIEDAIINYQLTPEELQDISLKKQLGKATNFGALAIKTGKFTGRSPKDRFIVKDAVTKDKVWWGSINLPFSEEKYALLHNDMVSYLSKKELYVRDCYACASKEHQLPIRVINEHPWSNLFVYNMFLRYENPEFSEFKEDWLVLNAPEFKANPIKHGTRQENFSILNFTTKTILIGGTGYTGEIKKGIFSALNFLLSVHYDILPMHCSANVGANNDTAIFFGLSGTGKTTLSTDPNRKLIGDDEHGWTKENVVFNFEGGCYAKVIDLSNEKEPDIYNAIKKGAVLENVIVDNNGSVDFTDASITQNTRVSYPIYHIKNIQIPSIGYNPKNIFFLTADAFGVLPPISKLTPEQAAYHFMSGYTAKVAGTEAGVEEPIPFFSACFGAPFMPLHPASYANMLSEKIRVNNVAVWLINTGWTGGPYGIGKRMPLKYTRAMIKAALSGVLGAYNTNTYHIHSIFGVAQPRNCPNVPTEILSPRQTWNNDEAYYRKAYELAHAFKKNFEQFKDDTTTDIIKGGPTV